MSTRDPQAERLDRIEEKIDKLSDAMIALARAEEKLVSIEKNNQNNLERMNRFSEKLDHIEERVNQNAHTVNLFNRLFWITVSISIGAVTSYTLM